MNICAKPPSIKTDLSRAEAIPALTIYMAALAAYQRRRSAKGRTVLFKSYRRWIGAFLDDDAEADRATINFIVALQNQPPESQEMGAAA